MEFKTRIARDEIAAVVLAAGASRRMGFPKALAPIGRVTFLERILGLYQRAGISAWVALGEDAEEIRSRPEFAEMAAVVNPRPELGPLSSLLIALQFLSTASAVIVHPVDHPLVSASTIDLLASRHRRTPACILIPVHLGKKGHPSLFPNRFFADLRDCPLEEGARGVLRRNPASTLLLPVEDQGILANLNTPADLARWRRDSGGKNFGFASS